MAKYNRTNEPLRKAKEFNDISFAKEIGEQNTLKSFDKVRQNNKLYKEGMALGASGGDIDMANDLVIENGVTIPKKEHRNFKAGYKRGLEIFKAQLNLVESENNNKTR